MVGGGQCSQEEDKRKTLFNLYFFLFFTGNSPEIGSHAPGVSRQRPWARGQGGGGARPELVTAREQGRRS